MNRGPRSCVGLVSCAVAGFCGPPDAEGFLHPCAKAGLPEFAREHKRERDPKLTVLGYKFAPESPELYLLPPKPRQAKAGAKPHVMGADPWRKRSVSESLGSGLAQLARSRACPSTPERSSLTEDNRSPV